MARILSYVLELVLVVFVLRRLSRALLNLTGQPKVHVWTWRRDPAKPRAAPQAQGDMARDPVCGMFVSTELSERLAQEGKTLHFCSRDCLEKYQKIHAE